MRPSPSGRAAGFSGSQIKVFPKKRTLQRSGLLIQNCKSLILTVFHICFCFEKCEFIQIWSAGIWTETLTVAALITQIIYMDDLVFFHPRYLNGNICTVWTDFYAVFTDCRASQASACLFCLFLFLFLIPLSWHRPFLPLPVYQKSRRQHFSCNCLSHFSSVPDRLYNCCRSIQTIACCIDIVITGF